MLDVRRLRLLRDLARLGTIAAVAEAHSYTPSAVSQQLAVLEREAGVPLLERSGRRVVLTPAATVLVQHVEEVLAALERAAAALTTARTGLSGSLRIGAFPTAVHTLLPDALVALGRDHPGLDLMVTELDPVAVPDALRERRLDVALTHDYDLVRVEPDPALESVPLLSETVFLAVRSADGPAAGTDQVAGARTDQVAGARTDPVRSARCAAWIAGSPGTLCHTVAVQACRAAGFAPRVRHLADDFATVLALVAAGQGVALVPQLAVAQPPAGVRLVPLEIRRRTGVAYRRGAAAHPAVAAFVAAIRAATEVYGQRHPKVTGLEPA